MGKKADERQARLKSLTAEIVDLAMKLEASTDEVRQLKTANTALAFEVNKLSGEVDKTPEGLDRRLKALEERLREYIEYGPEGR